MWKDIFKFFGVYILTNVKQNVSEVFFYLLFRNLGARGVVVFVPLPVNRTLHYTDVMSKVKTSIMINDPI